MSGPAITYAPRPDATPQAEVSALAAIYRIALGAKQSDLLLDKVGPDDATLKNEKEVGRVDRWTDSTSGIAINDHER
jgi:hypothetical protein